LLFVGVVNSILYKLLLTIFNCTLLNKARWQHIHCPEILMDRWVTFNF
jgi:hypothetical protein